MKYFLMSSLLLFLDKKPTKPEPVSSPFRLTEVWNVCPEQPCCRLSALLHHTPCKTEMHIYCTVDILQPEMKKENTETGWNGLRQQRVWQRSDLDAESKSESAKDFPHHLWNSLERNWAQTLWSEGTPTSPGKHFTAVSWKPPISETLF